MARAGRILIAAGAVDEDFVHEVGSEIMAACTIRSRDRPVRTGMVTQMFRPFESAARDVPIGRAFRLADDGGRRYPVTFDGEGGTEVWRGVLRMSPRAAARRAMARSDPTGTWARSPAR